MQGFERRPYRALAVGIAAISFGAIFVRLAAAPAAATAALRMGFAALVLAPFALASPRARRELAALRPADAALLGAAGLFLALHFLLWISSLSRTGVASSVVIVTTGPLWVALHAAIFRRARLPGPFWLGLAAALAGGAIIGGSDRGGGGHRLGGDLLALGGAVAVAAYFIAGSSLRRRLSTLAYVAPVYAVAGALLAGAAAVSGIRPAAIPPAAWGWCFLMALVCQVAGHSIFNWALRSLPATAVSIATLGEPVGAAILALLVLGEAPRPSDVAGGCLILAGMATALRARAPGAWRPRAGTGPGGGASRG